MFQEERQHHACMGCRKQAFIWQHSWFIGTYPDPNQEAYKDIDTKSLFREGKSFCSLVPAKPLSLLLTYPQSELLCVTYSTAMLKLYPRHLAASGAQRFAFSRGMFQLHSCPVPCVSSGGITSCAVFS